MTVNGIIYGSVPTGSDLPGYAIVKNGNTLVIQATQGNVNNRDGNIILEGYGVPAQVIKLNALVTYLTGNLTVIGGISLGDETINSWAEVRSNWGWRYTSLNNQTIEQIDINVRQKTTIITTLTADHTLTFNLLIEANVMNEWLIVFTTGTTVPKIGISRGSNPLYWQNKQNILNNLSPNTTYRIYVDSDMAMYETF